MNRLRLPTKGTQFAAETIASLARRAKAIRYTGAHLEWRDVVEIEDGIESDIARLDVEISQKTAMGILRLSLKVWDDRWVCVDSGFLQKHRWVWASAIQGRFVGKEGARDLVRKIEEALNVGASTETDVPDRLEKVWRSSLAKGPRPV
jgi:hypothetical protein